MNALFGLSEKQGLYYAIGRAWALATSVSRIVPFSIRHRPVDVSLPLRLSRTGR
jgi:hypothetical protein